METSVMMGLIYTEGNVYHKLNRMLRLSIESLPSLVGKHPTASTAFDATSSHHSTTLASSPNLPAPATAISLPSSSTLPPATVASSPPATSNHEGGCSSSPANFLASKGLQRLIRKKEELTSERDELLVERDQTVLRLSKLQTKATEAVVLEARLQSRRGGRLRNLGSSSIRGSSLRSSSSSPSFRTRGSFSQRSSSRGKEPAEPVREPTVEEIVPAELSFYNDRRPLEIKLFRLGVFTLVARSKRVLVSPEDDRDRGWYARFVVAPTVGLVGDESVPFPKKWNFAPTMGIVEEISNFRGWVGKLLNITPMEGFVVRGISVEAVVASRISLERAQEIILGSSSKRKAASDQDSKEEEDGEVGSSSRSGAMRRVTIEVSTEVNLLRKSSQACVWLKPLIGPVERAKLDSHNSMTLMNDIVHASLKVNLIGTEMMKRVTLLEQLVCDYQVEADSWKEQCESFQIDVETLEESKSTLEQQVRALTSELAVEKAYSNQAGKEKAHMETSFSEQLSKASEEIRESRDLLGEKEAYAGELVQNLTQTQEDLRVSSDKAFLNSRHDTLVKVSQENFNLESELAKIKETIDTTQQNQDFSSPVAEVSENVEDDTSIPTPSSQVEHVVVDVPASVPSSSQ
ncbi:uncharacterized protein [Nicotiana sylvestris]|uniref:uncharacterized protein n=1 Tax=Nicotiana sylvestris TaxID=4096 RepID=UPI00388C82B1